MKAKIKNNNKLKKRTLKSKNIKNFIMKLKGSATVKITTDEVMRAYTWKQVIFIQNLKLQIIFI